ncbi:MAG: ribonuclease N [Propionibacteriales bacterium]|nr:ribonuclease N [Propionibacteriales bacterium]
MGTSPDDVPGGDARNDDQTSSVSPAPDSPAPDSPAPDSDLPTVDVADLPAEAHDTIGLIESDGPFPYDRDGATFENREGLLPDRERGFYQEYTVETPRSDDRGARRIVAGRDDAMFYTEDHYDSFRRIVR